MLGRDLYQEMLGINVYCIVVGVFVLILLGKTSDGPV